MSAVLIHNRCIASEDELHAIGWAEYDLKYDAWNRLIEARDDASSVSESSKYDGANRRILSGGVTDLYYSDQWQMLEEWVGTQGYANTRYVWGLRYGDDLVLRDRLGSPTPNRLYALHDYFNVTAVIDSTATIYERYGTDSDWETLKHYFVSLW